MNLGILSLLLTSNIGYKKGFTLVLLYPVTLETTVGKRISSFFSWIVLVHLSKVSGPESGVGGAWVGRGSGVDQAWVRRGSGMVAHFFTYSNQDAEAGGSESQGKFQDSRATQRNTVSNNNSTTNNQNQWAINDWVYLWIFISAVHLHLHQLQGPAHCGFHNLNLGNSFVLYQDSGVRLGAGEVAYEPWPLLQRTHAHQHLLTPAAWTQGPFLVSVGSQACDAHKLMKVHIHIHKKINTHFEKDCWDLLSSLCFHSNHKLVYLWKRRRGLWSFIGTEPNLWNLLTEFCHLN